MTEPMRLVCCGPPQVDKKIGASHFALLSTVEVVGKGLATTVSGVFADTYGFVALFQCSVVLSAACMLLLLPLYSK